EDEVGFGIDYGGIMLLFEVELGMPLADVLPIADAVLLLESTGNRPDLLSIHGIAREVATIYDLPLSDASRGPSPERVPNGRVEIQIDDFGGCPRYVGRLFEDVAVASSPVWLRARVHAAGMRPISNV